VLYIRAGLSLLRHFIASSASGKFSFEIVCIVDFRSWDGHSPRRTRPAEFASALPGAGAANAEFLMMDNVPANESSLLLSVHPPLPGSFSAFFCENRFNIDFSGQNQYVFTESALFVISSWRLKS
jgi:hypothetical protein